MPYCKLCGKWALNLEYHKCPPIFEVCQPDYDDDCWAKIYAIDAEEAAENWAEKDDEEECSIVGGEPATVLVRKLGEEKTEKFVVSGEAIPHYYATLEKEVDDENKND